MKNIEELIETIDYDRFRFKIYPIVLDPDTFEPKRKIEIIWLPEVLISDKAEIIEQYSQICKGLAKALKIDE